MLVYFEKDVKLFPLIFLESFLSSVLSPDSLIYLPPRIV